MAFIPDNSFRQRLSDKISQVLWEFYQYLCIKRNHESKLSSGTMEQFLQIYGYGRASKFNILKEMKVKGWIDGEDGRYRLLVGDFSPVDQKAQERKALREKQSKKLDSKAPESKKLDLESVNQSKKLDQEGINQSKKLDSLLKEYQLLNQQDYLEREISACASFDDFEPFEETNQLVDGKFRFQIDMILFWIQQEKKLSRRNFPASEWLEVIKNLEMDGIHCVEGEGGFKHFYHWVESQDWVQTVSPSLLMGQIEKYKKREQLAAKNGGKKNDTGYRGKTKNGVHANKPNSRSGDERWKSRDGI